MTFPLEVRETLLNLPRWGGITTLETKISGWYLFRNDQKVKAFSSKGLTEVFRPAKREAPGAAGAGGRARGPAPPGARPRLPRREARMRKSRGHREERRLGQSGPGRVGGKGAWPRGRSHRRGAGSQVSAPPLGRTGGPVGGWSSGTKAARGAVAIEA